MADRWAVANGNWSNTATWNGGTLPGTGDDVFADGWTVTINQDVTVSSLQTTERSGGTAGGTFTTSGKRTVNADTYAGETDCLILNAGSIQNGDSYGGQDSFTAATIVNIGCVQIGNSVGGSGMETLGTLINSGGLQKGNVTGGDSPGTINFGGILIGDIFGGSFGPACNVAGGGIVFGDVTAGSGLDAVGLETSAGGIALIGVATENNGNAAVVSSSNTRHVVIVKNIANNGALQLNEFAETDSTNVPFISFEGGGGGAAFQLVGGGGLVY
jgi:hypothetical protein